MKHSTALWIALTGALLIVLPGFNAIALLLLGIAGGNTLGRAVNHKELA